MKLEFLVEFDTCARLLNMHNAADSLFIAQSSLSKHMKALEKDVGCPLFTYAENKIRLTYQGARFLEGIQPVLREYEALSVTTSNCAHRSNQNSNELSLTAQQHSSIDLTTECYYRLINSFMQENPDFTIHFARKARQTFDEKARDGLIDLFIDYRFGNTKGLIDDYTVKGLTAFPLCRENLAIWCHKDNPLNSEPLHPCDLRHVPIMTPADASAPYLKAIEELGHYYGYKPLFNMIPSSNQAEFLCRHNKEAVYIYSESFLQTALFSCYDDMVVVPFQDNCAPVQSFALSYPNGNLGAQAIISFIKQKRNNSLL